MTKVDFHLNRNEFFFEHAPEVRASFSALSQGLTHYASKDLDVSLVHSLSALLSVDEQNITLGHGAEDILSKTLLWLRNRYPRLLLSQLCWGNYIHIVDGLDFKIERFAISRKENLFIDDFSDLKSQLSHFSEPTICLIASPNNPTGHRVDVVNLKLLVEAFPQHIFIVDAVYDTPRSPLLPQAQYNNVVFVGSLSKFYGLPGLRVGYAVSKILPRGFQLSLGLQPGAVQVAQAAIAQTDWYLRCRENAVRSALSLQSLNNPNITFFKSDTSFVLMALSPEISETRLQHAVKETSCMPKVFEAQGQRYLRWSMGADPIPELIRRFVTLICQPL